MSPAQSPRRALPLLLLVVAAAACGGNGAPPADQAQAAAGPQAKPGAPGDPMAAIEVTGFMTPESVLHDSVADVYLVSNINGTPTDKDDNGFISRVTPTGEIEQLKWIDGAAPAVTLHGPKGLAVKGDTRYVADIDCVRRFLRTSGAPAGEICFRGATFLNDIAMDVSGTLYVTDSGLNPDFSPSGTDAIWRFSPDGQTSKLQQGDSLGHPNGIAFNDQDGYVVTFGSGEIYQFGPDNKRRVVLPGASGRALDGIVFTNDGGYAFSSWGDSAVYVVTGQGATSKLLEHAEADSPADIGYDAKRNRILVPLFTPNKVVIKQIPAAPVAAPAGGG